MTYADSGVDIDAGNALVERIKPAVRRTWRRGVLTGLGGFAGLFEPPLEHYREPVLVSATDGVGTKLQVAGELNRHDTIGIDLVAMCVNDIVVCGAEPLYFLDYFATGKLELEQAQQVIEGIARGCESAGCALLGGETAEMPGMYSAGDYDLAGFAVGIAEKSKIIDRRNAAVGDILIGLPASGPHANGYSLIRKIIENGALDPGQAIRHEGQEMTFGEALLAPTRIYVKSILGLLETCRVSALCHITGGGFTENLPRVLPNTVNAEVDLSTWSRPAVFDRIAECGDVQESEMLRTFNCGIGMVAAVRKSCADEAIGILTNLGEAPRVIGRLVAGHGEVVYTT